MWVRLVAPRSSISYLYYTPCYAQPTALAFYAATVIHLTSLANPNPSPLCRLQRIRYVTPDGTLQVLAGDGVNAYTGDDGPAVDAELFFPGAVCADSVGNICAFRP